MATKAGQKKPTILPTRRYLVSGRFVGKHLTNEGETLTRTQWARRFGISTAHFCKMVNNKGADYVFTHFRRITNALHGYQGEVRTARGWADSIGISYQAFMKRVGKYGIADAIAQGATKPKLLTYEGESLTNAQWARRLGMTPDTFMKRWQLMGLGPAIKKGPVGRITYTHNGKTLSCKEWAARLGMTEAAFRNYANRHGMVRDQVVGGDGG